MKRVSNVTVRKRLVFILLCGIVIFSIIDVRLGYVQFGLGDMLTNRAKALWSRSIPFEGERGKIEDRNGVPIASNQSAPTIFIIPRQVKDPAKTAEKLGDALDADKEKLYKEITQVRSIVRIKEGRKISNEKANAVRRLGLLGVYIAEDSKRYYPFGRYLSHVLGFTGADNQGLTGLELYYDDALSGKKGAVEFYTDAKGKKKMKDMADEYEPPKNGLDLKLTVDTKVQTIIERELDNAEKKYHPDGLIAIAMDPGTGEILGMSSRPSYTPDNYKNVPQEVYNRNLPIWSTYEPGSTFKIITLAAALEEKKVNLTKDKFYDSGAVEVGGSTLHCWKRGGHGSETFLEVVQNSCNPGFVELGERLGKNTLFKYIRNFGFGTKTGVDLSGEASGILFNLDRVGPVELATTAFGQGVSVTPIQQVAAVSAAVNGGILYKPYIAKELVDPKTGETVMRKNPVAKRRVISENTSKQIRHALETVVTQGSGKNAYVDGYPVGGKTGTAQKAKNGRYLENNYVLSFIGFAPANDPKIVVYLAVDNPKNTIQFGGQVAAPIAGTIIGDSLRAMGVKPVKNQAEKEKSYFETPTVKVPNLIGETKKEMMNDQYNLKLDVSGSGNKVIRQSPEAGVKVEEGSTIRVYMQ
ncbi:MULTISPECIES: stage V sporulation protein D [Heyndrickxia]|uniref:serine-type D-Ala-D-Ala carboxypeptidase n=3 Tax=Heyndrickxia TaxID=2837504 RepID=G2TJX6_HEYCO|nr:stage V sporulation protein D [Heyndrickxia coagulans]AEO99397.1 stage V sporulation protein D [Heyndrickxia coagulans 36D1]APB35783.1 stage V sporulation protein D [Heyndrickxia coagulans]AVD55730.1 stage V sporulation protein D [Heyndrickxia coagulans]KYC90396.1 Cell division protein FtsI [Heyndrickxia coagulans]MDT9755569.1 stage V sporulation protein D [Heyndrickxia coagulans]